MALEDMHLWMARFDSFERWADYLEEHYCEDRDDRPLNQFAADQGEVFYDHDWIEGNFSAESESASVREWLTKLLSGFSYTDSWLAIALDDAVRSPLAGVNAVIGINDDEIRSPRSAVGDGYQVQYVGTYQRMPPTPTFDPEATKLNLNDQRLTLIPAEVFDLIGLEELSVGRNSLIAIPEEIGRLRNLRQVNIYENQLTELPDALFALPHLQTIMAQKNLLRSLPTSIGGAPALTGLSVPQNALTRLPDEIGDMSALEVLDVASNELKGLPPSIGGLTRLRTLRIGGNEITRLPDEIVDAPVESQLSLPQFFEESAQTPIVQAWLDDPIRRRRHRR